MQDIHQSPERVCGRSLTSEFATYGIDERIRRGEIVADVVSHTVRDVAPKKLMLCCSFRLPATAAYDLQDRDAKRHKPSA